MSGARYSGVPSLVTSTDLNPFSCERTQGLASEQRSLATLVVQEMCQKLPHTTTRVAPSPSILAARIGWTNLVAGPREAEVTDLQRQPLVQHDVVGLDVAMRRRVVVDVVDAVHQLQEVVPGQAHRKRTTAL
eukprot:2429667-Rhodomonas_salina.1